MREQINNFLDYYVNQPDPRYAVMITGPWGCGKTHFIKHWMDRLTEKNNNDKTSTLTKPIYISLFGLSSIQQINNAITREIYPIMKSRIYTIGKQALNVVSNITLNCDFSRLSKRKEMTPGEASIELDLVSLFRSGSFETHENRIIIFDDFERCGVDLPDMLGYFNQFVEHSNIRVIIICNEEEIENKNIYEKFKEKLIGRLFLIEPDSKSAISEFCKTPGVNPLSEEQQLVVKDVFEKVGFKNLRSLYQGLQDFSSVLKDLRYDDTNNHQRDIIKRIMIQYVVAYCEYPANEKVREIASFDTSKFNILSFNYRSGNDSYKKLRTKYDGLAGYTPYDWVFDSPMSDILHSIVDGGDISIILNDILNHKESEGTIYQKLCNFPIMENDEFETTYSAALEYIVNPNSDIIEIIQLISKLLDIDSSTIRNIDDEVINRCMNNVASILSALDNLEKFLKWKESQFDRIMTGIKHFSDNSRMTDFAIRIEQIVLQRISELEKNEIRKLEEINNDNFDEIVSIYFHQLGSLEVTKYAMKPFFDCVDPIKLAEALSGISNKNKWEFECLLLNRYDIQQGVELSDCFGKEHDSLVEISNQLQAISETRKDIDKWMIGELSRVFRKVSQEIKPEKS